MVIAGIIKPPPEIRAVADRTAAYVAKNGRAFEKRILSSAKGKTPKFAFLQSTSPFHAYYEDRITFYANGGEDEKDGDNGGAKNSAKSSGKGDGNSSASSSTNKGPAGNKSQPPTIRKQAKRQKASAMEPIAKALLEQRTKIATYRQQQEKEEEERQKAIDGGGLKSGDEPMDDNENDNSNDQKPAPIVAPLKPPPPLDFVSIVAPSNLNRTQIETIQLVAQFTAMDGKGGPFLQQLTIREWNNPTFAFCKPRNPHFSYFSALVDAYRKIIQEWTFPPQDNSTSTASPSAPVTPQMVLQDIAYRVEYERDMEENEEEGEIIPINWHDFVVVETIDFPADEVFVESMLPPPPTSSSVDAAAAAASAAAGLPSSMAPAGIQTTAGTAVGGGADGNDMEESDDDEDEEAGETIRVVPTYTPKVVGATDLSGARVIDPITGKSVAVADMPEHMRIQLLDPKWAEEKKKFQDKQKDSNLVSDEAIASNINRLARAREAEEMDGKSGLSGQEEANRILREQAQGPGPSLPPRPPPPPPPPMSSLGHARPPLVNERDPKRQRLDPSVGPVPPPPPPPGPSQEQPKVTRAPPLLPPPSAVGGPLGGIGSSAGMDKEDDGTNARLPASEPTVASDLGVVPAFPPQASTVQRKLVSEEEFIASLEKPEVTLNVRVPNDSTQMAWNFYGQIVSITVNVTMKVKDVKAELSKQHLNEMPPNKIELKDTQAQGGSGFLKNNQTLAALNIGPTANLEMKVKQRGSGRKG